MFGGASSEPYGERTKISYPSSLTIRWVAKDVCSLTLSWQKAVPFQFVAAVDVIVWESF